MRYSPLRYPGGKGKISSFFSELFVANNLIGGTYIEPYVGGGSIALSLLINGVANQIIINDKDVIYNGEKYEFYASNKNNLFEKPLTIILKEEIYS